MIHHQSNNFIIITMINDHNHDQVHNNLAIECVHACGDASSYHQSNIFIIIIYIMVMMMVMTTMI